MGCCESKIEKEEFVDPPFETLETQYQDAELSQTHFTNPKSNKSNTLKHDQKLIQTEEGFSDISLDSHENQNYVALETSKTYLGDSMVYYTRSTSISLYRVDIETAFLQSSGLLRRNTLDFSKQDPSIIYE
ncbi:hypothetical protein SteCoe_11048 [Stentor coeruleus]|uniref:Uncharacterized protein n=1 Tax=Stentor coeruleus TaxID=5963 RepID=A0A1R2CE52_9CILI|nr:hypothetical protein SteCoe_11048 [Stentor coeruleus]